MAAKSVVVRFFNFGPDEPVLRMELRWWPVKELCSDSRLIESYDGGYYDWNASITMNEFIELHERFRPLANSGVFRFDDWQKIIVPEMQIVDAVLAGGLGDISRVNVTVFSVRS